MKSKIIFLTLISSLLCSLFLIPVGAASPSSGSVLGHGIYEATPDYGEINFSFEGRGESDGKAKDDLNRKTEKILKTLKEYGTITSDSYFSYYDQNGNAVCQRCYVLSTTSPQKLNEVQEKLINAGASSVCPPTYFLKNRANAEKKALEAAIADAKSRANSLGLSGEITAIRDLGTGDHCRFYFLPSVNGRVIIEARVMLMFKKI